MAHRSRGDFRKLALHLTLALALAGCATEKILAPTGGSRADGTVELGYDFWMAEKPVVDYPAAQQRAVERCKVWGYSGAEAFGGGKQQCLQVGRYGCEHTQVSITYQCTGSPSAQ